MPGSSSTSLSNGGERANGTSGTPSSQAASSSSSSSPATAPLSSTPPSLPSLSMPAPPPALGSPPPLLPAVAPEEFLHSSDPLQREVAASLLGDVDSKPHDPSSLPTIMRSIDPTAFDQVFLTWGVPKQQHNETMPAPVRPPAPSASMVTMVPVPVAQPPPTASTIVRRPWRQTPGAPAPTSVGEPRQRRPVPEVITISDDEDD